jgi:hypothetical protein
VQELRGRILHCVKHLDLMRRMPRG